MDAPGPGWAAQTLRRSPFLARDPERYEIETLIRMAIRDAVNRNSRKPFYWGGLAGYQQLEAIDQALSQLTSVDPDSTYFEQLAQQVRRALDKNRTLANNLKEAHQWLQQIADCLRYPRRSYTEDPINSRQVAREMQELLDRFNPDPKYQRPQSAIQSKLDQLWNLYGPDLLHTYDLPGLPPDNLQIESLFGRLRRHQRRVSGRKATRPLREFGHYQVLFSADSPADLLHHLRTVPLDEYRKHRQQLENAETTRRFIHCLHRDAEGTMQRLVNSYTDLSVQQKYDMCNI
jgi:hypothetical protein